MMMMMRVPSTRRTTIVPRASRLSSSKKKRSPTPASSKLKKTNELDVATGIGIEKLRTKNKSVVGVSTKKVSLPPHYPSEYKPGAAVVGGVFLATSLVTKYLTTGEAIGVSGLHRHPQKPAFLIGLLFGTQILLNVFDLSYLLPDGGFQSVQNSVRLGIAGWCRVRVRGWVYVRACRKRHRTALEEKFGCHEHLFYGRCDYCYCF